MGKCCFSQCLISAYTTFEWVVNTVNAIYCIVAFAGTNAIWISIYVFIFTYEIWNEKHSPGSNWNKLLAFTFQNFSPDNFKKEKKRKRIFIHSNLQLLAGMHALLCSTYKWTKRMCSSFNPLLEQILVCLPAYSKKLKLIHHVIQNSNISLWQKCWLLEKTKHTQKKNLSLPPAQRGDLTHQALSVHKSWKVN